MTPSARRPSAGKSTYDWPISENLVRRVVERVGRMQEECEPEVLQEELQAAPQQTPELVVVGVDGSMLPTRGQG